MIGWRSEQSTARMYSRLGTPVEEKPFSVISDSSSSASRRCVGSGKVASSPRMQQNLILRCGTAIGKTYGAMCVQLSVVAEYTWARSGVMCLRATREREPHHMSNCLTAYYSRKGQNY